MAVQAEDQSRLTTHRRRLWPRPASRRMPEPVLGVLLLLPAFLLLALLTLYPVLYGVWISFFNKHSFFPQQSFVGLSNYAAIVADPEFWASVRRGAVYSLDHHRASDRARGGSGHSAE